jgi:hypothetical protein
MPIKPNPEWQKRIAELEENIKAALAQSALSCFFIERLTVPCARKALSLTRGASGLLASG